MSKVTRTIKLKFLDLLAENTRLANELLAMPYMKRREMTTEDSENHLEVSPGKSNDSAYHLLNWTQSEAI